MMMLYIAVIIRWRGAKRVSPKALEHKKNQIFENYITGGKQRNAVLVFLITCVTFYLGTTFTRQVDFFYNFAVTELNAIINMCSYWHNHVFLVLSKRWFSCNLLRHHDNHRDFSRNREELLYQTQCIRWYILYFLCLRLCFSLDP